jgi:hypothetical protein
MEEIMSARLIAVVGILTTFSVIGLAGPVLAGPPLLCHPYEIAAAPSLPWQGHDWWPGRGDYKVANLVADTQALLAPATPVIVRMETLRRATIYAMRDRNVATQLLAVVTERARALERDGHPDALAWLDAAYLTEALREVAELARMSDNSPFNQGVQNVQGLTAGADGYALILKSLELRPDDPSIEFAAALIAERDRGSAGHPPKFDAHARKARAGAKQDALLARNLDHIS